MTRRKKVLLGGVAGIAVVLGGAGTAYAAHFQDRALPGSTLAGESVAGLSRDEVTAAVRERAADVTVTLEAGEATRTHPWPTWATRSTSTRPWMPSSPTAPGPPTRRR